MLKALGDAIMDAAVLARYETHLRPEDLRWKGWLEGQLTKVWAALDSLEKDWLPFLEGRMTMGHIAAAAALGDLFAPGHQDLGQPIMGWRNERCQLELFLLRT